MKLCVDSREQYKIPAFRKYIDGGNSDILTGVEIVTWKAGDVGTPDLELGWERKAEDFIPSMFNGTLDKQLHELKNNFAHPYLFIEYEGIMDLIEKNPNVNPSSIVGEMSSILARHKVTVCFVGTFYIPIVCRVCDKFYDTKNPVKNYSPIRTPKKPSRKKATLMEIKLDMGGRLPNVGAKKLNKLFEHFDNSIRNIANATVEELMEVDGVGEKNAKDIYKVLK